MKNEILASIFTAPSISRWRLIFHFSLTGQIESNYDEVTDSFDSMDLKPDGTLLDSGGALETVSVDTWNPTVSNFFFQPHLIR
jgi:hypothetical protein